jgi:hypothetical protein
MSRLPYRLQLYPIPVSEYRGKRSKIHDELCNLDKKIDTAIAEGIADCNEVDITNPIFDIPRKCASKHKN